MAEDEKQQRPVRKLTVENFSVIKHAKLEFGKITVLIGPQASGKSLLCKLAFFAGREILETAARSVMNGHPIEALKRVVVTQFVQRFSSHSGLGGNSFVEFLAGSYLVRLRWEDLPGNEDISVEFSKKFEELYIRLAKSRTNRVLPDVTSQQELQNDTWISLSRLLAHGNMDAYMYDTIFIPADRSLFTDANKGVTLVQSPGLDPLVGRFGAEILWGGKWKVGSLTAGDDALIDLNKELVRLVGGAIHTNGGEPVFKAKDGRELPLPLLSSGTQELVPLLNVLERLATQQEQRQVYFHASVEPQRIDSPIGIRVLVYLEEPEANVFPTTQSDLVRLFTWLSNRPLWDFSWVITTHSPYVLTACNNLIEADQVVAARPELRGEVAKLIPEQYWIKRDDFRAYAIEDGVLRSIVAEDTGLISTNYLDSVSETIGVEFDELLRLGYVKP